MAARKSLEMTFGMILNQLPNMSQMKCNLPQERASAQIRIDQHSHLDGGAHKLGNDVWHVSETIASKVGSQIGSK